MPDAYQDFYAGYEGEPEFLFFVDRRLRVRCWEGHLAAFLDAAEPEGGRWTGLAEAHHLDLWGDHPWQVTDSAECLRQLRKVPMRDGISADYAREADEVRRALVDLFEDAVATRAKVVVERD